MDFQTKASILAKLQGQVQNLTQLVNSKANALKVRESQIKQGQLPNTSTQNLYQNLRQNLSGMGDVPTAQNASPPSGLAPGNVGDINMVIWPYFFTTDIPNLPLSANQTFQTGFSNTYEAAFIFMSFTKTVYLNDAGSWGWLNPDTQFPNAPGLVFTLRDSSSSRQFYDKPIDIDQYGHPRHPTKFPRPIMLLPNQVMQIQFTNTHPFNQYIPFITVFGYRLRIEDAQKFLSLIYG
jgi:hypothetical protein